MDFNVQIQLADIFHGETFMVPEILANPELLKNFNGWKQQQVLPTMSAFLQWNGMFKSNPWCMVPEILVDPEAKPEFAIYSRRNFARIFLTVVHHPIFSSPAL